MGFFSRKSESYWARELLSYPDEVVKEVLRGTNAPVRSPKELRKMIKEDRRCDFGEKGIKAIQANLQALTAKGAGTQNRNHPNIHPRDRMHPAAWQARLDAEAKKRGQKPPKRGQANYQNIPLKDRVHPAEYRRLMAEAEKKQKQKGWF